MLTKNDDLKLDDFKEVSMSAIDIEDAHYNWSCCCSEKKTDSRLLKFISIYFIIMQVFVFCIYKLHTSTSCEQDSTYIGLLTFIIGLIIPSH